MKKNVYLVQANVTYSDFIAYLPYAAGCIMAYALNDKEITEKYDFGDILYRRHTVEEALEQMKAPAVVGFSCYIWNMEYNKALARAVKERYPDCLIVFGGHNIPFDTSLLDAEPYIDVLMHGEGERSFAELLKAFDKGDISGVDGISCRRNGAAVMNRPADKCLPVDDLPSPYLTGLFDKMLEKDPQIGFQGTLETNRGCPYSCAFCDWCFSEKVRFFPMEKIKKEIDWLAEHKIPYCYCADSNFGIAQRDLEIAEYVVKRHNETGYPAVFKPCYAKNSNDLVFKIGCILNSTGVDKGVTLAYQSMDPQVLENIGRRNLDVAYYTDLNARYSAVGIPTYTELILGLPGETYESFCHGLCSLLEAGQHNSMTVYTCQVYCNSPIAQPEYRDKYGIRWERQKLHGIHYPANFNGVQEYYDVIVETKDMSKADWVRANMFSVTLQSFHHLGLLRCFALYARHELNISYFEFYNRLLDYIFADNTKYIYSLFEKIRHDTEDTSHSDWCYQNDIFSKVGWYFEEGIFLDLAYNFEEYKKDIRGFISSLGIEKDIADELFKYQCGIIRKPGQTKVILTSEYDFYTYIENIYENRYSPLEKKKTELTIYPAKEINTWDVYAREIIWYGKRRSATLLTNPFDRKEIKYV